MDNPPVNISRIIGTLEDEHGFINIVNYRRNVVISAIREYKRANQAATEAEVLAHLVGMKDELLSS